MISKIVMGTSKYHRQARFYLDGQEAGIVSQDTTVRSDGDASVVWCEARFTVALPIAVTVREAGEALALLQQVIDYAKAWDRDAGKVAV